MRQGEYAFYDFEPAVADMKEEVLEGLTAESKYLSPKYFYDMEGSRLFEKITQLDEYYLTRTEMSLFDSHLSEVSARVGEDLCLIEYGSGSSKKIRKLLEQLSVRAYVPIDISNTHLQENARALHRDFPHLDVFPVCADITQPFELPPGTRGLTRLGFFPGSSIGNFEPQQAQRFLAVIREEIGQGGVLLIGVDRKKPVDVLERAYDDEKGVTAAFNLNVLRHINHRLDTDFDLSGFEHEARYDEVEGCVKMYLVSKRHQVVEVDGSKIEFEAGECVHTENSYKYHPGEFLELANSAGFALEAEWSDSKGWFSLFLLKGVGQIRKDRVSM